MVNNELEKIGPFDHNRHYTNFMQIELMTFKFICYLQFLAKTNKSFTTNMISGLLQHFQMKVVLHRIRFKNYSGRF